MNSMNHVDASNSAKALTGKRRSRHKRQKKDKRKERSRQESKRFSGNPSYPLGKTPLLTQEKTQPTLKPKRDDDSEEEDGGGNTQTVPKDSGSPANGLPSHSGAKPHDGDDSGRREHAKAKNREHRGRRRKRLRETNSDLPKPSSWALSDQIGGQFTDLPPLFVAEETLVAATDHAVNVYSNKDSLLDRSLTLKEDSSFSSYAVSASDSSILYASTVQGDIGAWTWNTGDCLGCIKVGRTIVDMCCALVEGEHRTTVFTVERTRSSSLITAHRLRSNHHKLKTRTILLKTSKPLLRLKVLENGRSIVAMSGKMLHVGTRIDDSSKSDSNSLQYAWNALHSPENVACFDAIARQPETRSQKRPQHKQPSTIEVAAGSAGGCIYVFSDANDAQSEPRRLHWHREAVATLTYSVDGLYLISGGRETVLVQWQLETGRKDYLPHLESPIRSLTVAPLGSQYAVALCDNSIMVLSTAEMKPTAHYPGLQSVTFDTLSGRGASKSSTAVSVYSKNDFATGPTLIHPLRPLELLAAVPTTNTFIAGLAPTTTYLQTFSLHTQRHVSRQSLTRTHATDTSVGPEGTRLREPNVSQVAISSNGQWLASIEEWSPSESDLKDLISDPLDTQPVIEKHREITLRFWSWSEANSQWTLNTKVDSPHVLPDTKVASQILALTADPASTHFATIAKDNVLRIWTPKTRLPDGKAIWAESAHPYIDSIVSVPRSKKERKAANAVRTWWVAQRTIALESLPSPSTLHLRTLPLHDAALAYTNDGSGLAILQHFSRHDYNDAYPSPPLSTDEDIKKDSSTLLHLVDAPSGQILDTRAGMDTQGDPLIDIKFLERYLICLCREYVAVWDVTTWELYATIPLRPNDLSSPPQEADEEIRSKTPAPLLVVNQATGTFAIATHSPRLDIPITPLTASGSKKAPKAYSDPSFQSTITIYSLLSSSSSAPPLLPNNTSNSTIPQDVTTPLFTATLPRQILSLTSPPPPPASISGENDAYAAERKGYVLLDSSASLRLLRPDTLSHGASGRRKKRKSIVARSAMVDAMLHSDEGRPPTSQSAAPIATAGAVEDNGEVSEEEKTASDVAELEEDDSATATKHTATSETLKKELQNLSARAQPPEPPNVQPEQLQAAMEGPDGRLLGPFDIFKNVMGLFASKPVDEESDGDELEEVDEDAAGSF